MEKRLFYLVFFHSAGGQDFQSDWTQKKQFENQKEQVFS